MFEAVATVEEIEAIIWYTAHQLSVAIFPIPGLDACYLAEQFLIKDQRVWFATDVDSVTDEISTCEIGVRQTPRYGLAALFH
jgi:hypothetical protein